MYEQTVVIGGFAGNTKCAKGSKKQQGAKIKKKRENISESDRKRATECQPFEGCPNSPVIFLHVNLFASLIFLFIFYCFLLRSYCVFGLKQNMRIYTE